MPKDKILDSGKMIKKKVCIHLKCRTYIEGYIFVSDSLRFSRAVLKKLNDSNQFPLTDVIIDGKREVIWLVISSDSVSFIYPCENIEEE